MPFRTFFRLLIWNERLSEGRVNRGCGMRINRFLIWAQTSPTYSYMWGHRGKTFIFHTEYWKSRWPLTSSCLPPPAWFYWSTRRWNTPRLWNGQTWEQDWKVFQGLTRRAELPVIDTYIFCRAWAMTMPLVRSSTVLHGASTPNVWIWTHRHRGVNLSGQIFQVTNSSIKLTFWYVFNMSALSVNYTLDKTVGSMASLTLSYSHQVSLSPPPSLALLFVLLRSHSGVTFTPTAGTSELRQE